MDRLLPICKVTVLSKNITYAKKIRHNRPAAKLLAVLVVCMARENWRKRDVIIAIATANESRLSFKKNLL